MASSPRATEPARPDDDGAAATDGRAPVHPELGSFTAETFRPHVGTAVQAEAADGQTVELTLHKIVEEPRYTPRRARRTCFSLLFLGPAAPQLESGQFRLSHPELGDLGALFVNPIMPPDDIESGEGMVYQTIFN